MAKKKAGKRAIHACAKDLKADHPSLTWKEAHGVAKGIKTGKKPKKSKKKRR